jgi:hypothetical protein
MPAANTFDAGRTIVDGMSTLADLLEGARTAGPTDRFVFRPQIATHGAAAIPGLSDWLGDPRLGPFALRTLELIAERPGLGGAVAAVLEDVEHDGVTAEHQAAIEAAIVRIRAQQQSKAPAAGWPGAANASAIELEFHEDMLAVFRLAGEATRRVRPDGTVARGYWASYFLRGVRNHGGLLYAKQLLHKEGTTEGFARLKEEGRLDLTVEALVLEERYVSLFSPEERQLAASRLAAAGYQPRT